MSDDNKPKNRRSGGRSEGSSSEGQKTGFKSRGFKGRPGAAPARGPNDKQTDQPRSSRGYRDRPAPDSVTIRKRDRSNQPETAIGEESSERIAKRLARAGIASRREAEAIILAGRVAVNGKVLDSPAFNVTLSDKITLDGRPIPQIERTRLWLYHKPAGLLTSNKDPEGRATIFENLPADLPRVVTVGRLDINTEGLLLLTNDGGLARLLELPQTGWLRRYRVRAHGKIRQQRLDDLRNGIAVDGVFYGAIEATLEREQGSNVWIEMALREGKNREIKNVLGALGLEVTRLIRTSYGPFQLHDLPTGHVLEVKGRVLRDQLGEKLVEQSGANFDAPVLNTFPNKPVARGSADGDKRISAQKRGEWVSGTRDSLKPDLDRRSKGGRAPRSHDREDSLAQLSTRAPTTGAKGKPMGRGQVKGASEVQRSQRNSNVWMAPGARPSGKRKSGVKPGGRPPRRKG